MDLSKYIDRALSIISTSESLRSRLEDYREVLTNSMARYGDIVTFKDEVRYVFVGDIHGNLEDLKAILSNYDEEHLKSGNTKIVFLGDYIDRGESQLEVLITLLELKREYPDSIFLLKGNHEGVDIVEPSPHDFPDELISRYLISEGLKIYEFFVNDIFTRLHLAAYFRNFFLALHGGLPTVTYKKTQNVREYLLGSIAGLSRDVVVEVLWNDPIESIDEAQESPRGAGMLFGRPITEWVVKTFNVKLVIRGHEPCAKGYKLNHNGKVITLFSRTGPPYYNTVGAFLEVDTSARDWYKSIKETRAVKFIKQ
ncbi:MAG: metallophosphoesterase family protein [Sulfolobales archaeon]